MGGAIALRTDYDGATLRRFAKASVDANQTRRVPMLAAIYGDGKRSDAVAHGGVELQIIRDWVVRFNAHGRDGLIDREAPGRTSRLNAAHRAALADIVEEGPILGMHGVVRWRLVDLARWVWDEFHISSSKQTLSRELRAMGFRKLSSRPRHYAQNKYAIEAFKKTSPLSWRILREARRRARN